MLPGQYEINSDGYGMVKNNNPSPLFKYKSEGFRNGHRGELNKANFKVQNSWTTSGWKTKDMEALLRGLVDDLMPHHYRACDICWGFDDVVYVTIRQCLFASRKQCCHYSAHLIGSERHHEKRRNIHEYIGHTWFCATARWNDGPSGIDAPIEYSTKPLNNVFRPNWWMF